MIPFAERLRDDVPQKKRILREFSLKKVLKPYIMQRV